MEGGQWQRDRKWSPGYGGKGGFSTFLYLCNQREEKFLWLFLRMVCSQDLEHLFHQQPLASFPGATRTTIPVDWRPAARPPSALPWDHPLGLPLSVSWGCVPARAHVNGAANSAPGACWGGDKLCCAVLSCTRMVPLSSVLVSSTQQVSTVFFPVGVVLFNLHVTEQTSVGLWVW